MQSPAAFHAQIVAPCLPQAEPVLEEAAALDTAVDMVDRQPTPVERLVRHGLLPREPLPPIRSNSRVFEG